MTPRLFFLDWLRIIAFAVLVLYHVGLYYVRWDFHVKSPFAGLVGPALEPWMKLSEPWRMSPPGRPKGEFRSAQHEGTPVSLLFMVSGAATAQMLKAGAGLALLRRRSRQLLLPLLCGVLLIVPPQAYCQVVQKLGYAGSYLDFLGLYFSGYHGFCEAGHCLILPTWNHLWFLPYLWLYTALLCAVLALWPGALQGLAQAARRWLVGAALLVLPMATILLLRWALWARFPSTHALVDDGFNHAIYFGMFISGAVFALTPGLWDRLARLRGLALCLALGGWAALVFGRPGGLAAHAVIAVFQWSALVAAFGFAKQHLDVDHRWRARLTEAVFPVYLLHQTVIIVGSQWLLPLHWRPATEGPVLVLMTFGLSWLGYAVLRRFDGVRPWFGMSRQPKVAAQP